MSQFTLVLFVGKWLRTSIDQPIWRPLFIIIGGELGKRERVLDGWGRGVPPDSSLHTVHRSIITSYPFLKPFHSVGSFNRL